MSGLLTALAVIALIMLLGSASRVGGLATAIDPYQRGRWGIARWTSNRTRPLNPHERRWQTSLLSGRDNDSRWRDLVVELQALERLSGAAPIGEPPESHDAGWVERTIANLEETAKEKVAPGETA